MMKASQEKEEIDFSWLIDSDFLPIFYKDSNNEVAFEQVIVVVELIKELNDAWLSVVWYHVATSDIAIQAKWLWSHLRLTHWVRVWWWHEIKLLIL